MDPGATCHESMLITRNQIKASLGKTKLGMYNPTRCNLCPSEGGGFTNMGRNHDQDTSSSGSDVQNAHASSEDHSTRWRIAIWSPG